MKIKRMNEEMFQDSKLISGIKKIPSSVILACLIVIAVIRLCVLFSQRDGHHVDETWSYGFANSYEYGQIYDGYEDGSLGNIGKWITGDTFKDYITVSEDHRFAFDAVLRNSHYDLSPPLYILLLHFICSFFPGKFSWGFAFAISLMAFIPSLILLYLITKEFSKSKFCGFLCVVYYTFSGCGTANFIYLRVYHLLTFFTLLLLWLMIRIIGGESKNKRIFYCLLPVATILGSLTHYYFLIIAFALTLFSALLLLLKKRILECFGFGIVMLLSVIAFFLMYSPAINLILPAATGDATTSTGYYSYPYYFDLTIANIRFFQGTVGFYIYFTVANCIAFAGAVVFAAIIVALILFLFRNENWMKKIVAKTKEIIKNAAIVIWNLIKSFDHSIWAALFSCILYLLIIPASATLTNMGYTERYFFPAMTVFISVYSAIVGKIIISVALSEIGKKIRIIVSALIICLLMFLVYSSNLFTDDFKFDFMNEKDMAERVSGKNCYVIVSADRDLVWLSPILCECENIYIDAQSRFAEDDNSFPEFNSGDMFILARYGLLTDSQKAELVSENSFEIYDLVRPNANKTVDDILTSFEENNGVDCELVDIYPAFIGSTDLYEIK